MTVAPLASGAETSPGSWAVLAVGHLSDPRNTFWQVLSRPDGEGRWVVATPPGVADNGGLTADFAQSGASTVGFEPSQDLNFSPLATSVDGGVHWAPGLVPAPLAAVPDALADSAGGLAALVRRGGGTVLENSAAGASWATSATRSTLSRAGGGCAPGALVALAGTPDEGPFVGAACARRGRVGVFEREGARWEEVGPRLGAASAGSAVSLLRLTVVGPQLVGLAQASGRRGSALVAFWRAVVGGPWTVSAPLVMPDPSGLRSSATGPGPGVVVLLGTAGSAVTASIGGPGQPWVRLPAAPARTATVVPVTGGAFDALAVRGSDVTVSSLSPGGTRWQRLQVVYVPVVYGSSD
ncbi:MAG: hypothetical protein ACLP9C_09475 [Acidimicrobiales bacterium]